MKTYIIIRTNFYDFYQKLSEEQINNVTSQINNILSHDDEIDKLKGVLVRTGDFYSASILRKIEILILKSIHAYVYDNYKIDLFLGETFMKKEIYLNSPILSLKDLNDRFENMNLQMGNIGKAQTILLE